MASRRDDLARLAADQAALTGRAIGLYDDLAADYDRHLLEDCAYQAPGMAARALAALGPAPGLWLELGAGTGLVGRAVQALELPVRLVGLDVSASMLRHAPAETYVARVRADAVAGTPFAGESFAGALAVGLFEHVINPARVLAAVAPALAPGAAFLFTFCPNDSGRIAVFDEAGGFISHDVDLVARCLAACGFVQTDALEYPAYRNGPAGWVPHRLILAEKRAAPLD